MSKHDLTQGRVSAALARLTVPMMAGVSSSILVQALEMGFIGQLSTAHVAAITFTFPLVMVITGIALGISIGTSSVIARSVGTQRLTPQAEAVTDNALRAGDEVAMLATHSMILVAGLMMVLSALCWLAIDPLFTAMGATAELLPLIHSYLDIYLPSTVLFTATMVCGSIMRANGSANIPGAVMTIGAVINLLLDPIFIFGWFGFPAMELAGAATAMTLTRAGTLAVLLWFVLQDKMVLRENHFRHWYRSAKRILHVGLPAVATNLIGPITAAYITYLIADYGEAAVAGFGVANRIEAVAAMLMFALSGSIGPFVGQNWGAHRVDRVRDGVRASYVFCLGWGLLVATPLLLFGTAIAAFIDTSPDVINVAATYFALVPLSYGLWGVLMTSSASFNALGKPLPSTALSFGRMLIVYIPLATVLNDSFGYVGIFVATALSNAIFGIISWRWFARRLDVMAGQLVR
ncbi:MAG: MATE family efflux transporter [Proteobacteria bacterium]|nr:MATE family efflux transporter [Pseudomonadota bacterium]